MNVVLIIKMVINYLIAHQTEVGMTVVTVFELIARRKATEKDLSIISRINKVINFILPNIKVGGGTH